jgi:lipoprotein-anchoring transpeptidase ErfK/SrfK
MQRCVLMTLATSVLGSASAFAQQMPYNPYYPPPPVQMVAVQPQYAQPERPDLGGGFIEFLFGGSGGETRSRAPQYQPQPQPQYQQQPQYQPQPVPMQPAYAPMPVPVRPAMQARPPRPAMDPRYMKQEVAYDGDEKPGTIVINTPERLLYLVEEGGKALRYGIGVGRPGFTWAGVHEVTAKREWPDWRPPDDMLKRRPDLPRYMPGGPDNPLGARAMYLGSTLYRIHGSNEPWTIGQQVSSGCIHMRNEDVVDLYEHVKVGTKVIVI